MQCLQLSSKTKEREIRSPEKSRSKSSSRSSSRKAVRKTLESSPPLVRRQDANQDPLPWAGNLGAASGSTDNADALLNQAIHHHLHDNDPIGLQDQNGTSPTRQMLTSTEENRVQQLLYAEEKMKKAHEREVRRHEENAVTMNQQVKQMVQWMEFHQVEDQGSTMRIEELERQRDLISNVVGHVNRRHQETTEEYVHVVKGIEKASSAQHQRDEHMAEMLHQELGQLRNEASQSFAELEHMAQNGEYNMGMQYQKLTHTE